MQIAVVDNGTLEPKKILELLQGATVTVFKLEDADSILEHEFDLIVLSGSSRFPIVYNLDKLDRELRLIRESRAPLLGICYGCELISVSFGGTLRDMGDKKKGIYTVQSTVKDALLGERETFEVYEAHRWMLDAIPAELEILAHSELGPEIIRHRTRPIYGFQFHPEKMVDETYGDELFRSFIRNVVSTKMRI